jgi:hypothetical protein
MKSCPNWTAFFLYFNYKLDLIVICDYIGYVVWDSSYNNNINLTLINIMEELNNMTPKSGEKINVLIIPSDRTGVS